MDKITQYTGMMRDLSPELLGEGQYLYAENAVIRPGKLTHLTNENSNESCVTLSGQILGRIHLPHRSSYVLFLNNNTITVFNYVECTTKVVFNDSCLNFTTSIRGVYKSISDCEDVVYWVDGVNPVRYLNIDFPHTDCDKLQLIGCLTPVNSTIINTSNVGGTLVSGVYSFVARYTDGSGNGGNWSAITNPISIYDDSFSGDFKDVDGCPAGTPTTKSILLQFANLDETYKKVEIAVIKTVGSVTTVEKVAELDFTSTVIQYNYTGLTGQVIDIEDVLVPESLYLNAELIQQHVGRLLLSRIKRRNVVSLQPYFNDVQSEWFSLKMRLDQNEMGYKNPLHAANYKSFMGDEIYSLGAVIEFCDGSFSQSYHIPGVTSENAETCFTGVKGYSSIHDVVPADDPDNPFNCDKEVWEVFNTAAITDTPEQEVEVGVDDCGVQTIINYNKWHTGCLSYWVSNERYPLDKDCDGNYLYPVELLDGETVGQRIRYHKLPNRRLETHWTKDSPADIECPLSNAAEIVKPYDDLYIYPLGITLSNINIPVELFDVAPEKYHITYVQRNSTNKSIIAKGNVIKCFSIQLEEDFTGGIGVHPNYVVNGLFPNNVTPYGSTTLDYTDNSIYKFHSPNTNVDNEKPLLTGSHIHLEQEWSGKVRTYGVQEDNSEGHEQRVQRFNATLLGVPIVPVIHNRKLEGSQYVNAHSISNPSSGISHPLINFNQESGVFFELDELLTFEDTCGIYDETIGEHTDNSLIQYESGANSCDDNSSDCVKSWYISIKRQINNQYGSLRSQQYITTGNSTDIDSTTIDVFGDSFINYYSYRRTANVFNIVLGRGLPISTLVHGVYESDINVGLRHQETGKYYYPKLNPLVLDSGILSNDAFPEDSFLSEYRFDTETNQYINEGIDSHLLYDRDYSKVNDYRLFQPFDVDTLSCNCETTDINTTVVSDPDDPLSIVDGWRTFRQNNYLNVPSNFGRVTNLVSRGNELFAHTTDNLWRVFTSQDRVLGDSSSVYLGSGSIFTQDPLYIYMTEVGHAGLQQVDGTFNDHTGYYFLDDVGKTLYRFTDKLEAISDEGMKSFFDQHGFDNTYEGLSQQHWNNQGSGWSVTYDHEFERLLFTMRAYEPKTTLTYEGGVFTDANGVTYDGYDEAIFCDRSYTLSYSYLSGHWVSFHDYIPIWYLPTRNKLFSFRKNGIWKHGKPNEYQRFYDTYHGFTVQQILSTPLLPRVYNSVTYYQDAERFMSEYNKSVNVDETFTQVHLHNSQQSSGILSVTNKNFIENYMVDTIMDIPGEVFAEKRENKWSINRFYDEVSEKEIPFTSCECSTLPTTSKLNLTAFGQKEYWDIEPLRDTHLIIDFTLNDEDKADLLFTMKYLLTNNTNTPR